MQVAIGKLPDYVVWYENQTDKFKGQIEKRLMNIEREGHFGNWKNLGDGLAEIKFNNGCRIYFSLVSKEKIILIAGGNKNGQSKDIEKARKQITLR
jgi:putative addiction module killer protein